MKRVTILVVAMAMALLLATVVLVGCSTSTTDSSMDANESTTTTQAVTATTAGGDGGGVGIPDPVAGQYVDLTPEQANALIDTVPAVIIIDVSPYYADGHLPGAVSYYPATALAEAIPTLDPEAVYLVYCHGDAPSIAGAEALVDAGFTMVYRLEGNYSAWVDAGYPVEQ